MFRTRSQQRNGRSCLSSTVLGFEGDEDAEGSGLVVDREFNEGEKQRQKNQRFLVS